MTDTEPAVPHAPMVASWTAPVIDTGKVHDELDRLWGEWSEAKRVSLGDGLQSSPEWALMRASTLNLIAIAGTPREAERIEATVSSLTEFSPSRTVILVRSGAPKAGGLGVRVSVHEHSLGKSQAAIRFESVTIAAKRGSDELLASVTSPLLVAELPDFLWVPRGEIAGNPLLSDLLELADRVIVDTATLEEPGGNLRFLADLAQQPKPAPKVSDLVWSRLMPWRQLIAQFFDQPTTQPCLDCIDEVTISYGAADDAGRAGLTAALLTAGWLATRLEWRAPGELVRSKDGWRLTLRAGPKGRSREVLLSLRPTDSAPARSCLGAVTLVATGADPGEFTVERTGDVGITTVSETPTMPKVSRLVYGRQPDDTHLLSQELRNFAGDPIYEEALVFAADLWPEGEE
ncbi:MAG TPA: glucose-6-phosphate dehydrogenase assembly protein OpcA [Thermomicrobiales bacterium]|jgi:glucose-6-phosphate dehydrogenase assembly protein OpcA